VFLRAADAIHLDTAAESSSGSFIPITLTTLAAAQRFSIQGKNI
jgi:hypothetical protein